MKIGMMNNPRADLAAEIAWASQNRFEFLDLTLEPSSTHPRQIDIPTIRQALKDANLEIIGHTAYYLPLASPIESLREAARTEISWAVEVLAELGALKVTVHPDRSIPFVLGPKGVLQNNVESLAKIADIAAGLGLQVLVENMDRTFNNVDQIREALNRLPQVGFHLDAGHANLNVERNRTAEFIAAFRDRLSHVHVSDNFGKTDDLHLPLGAGNIQWKKVIGALKRSGYNGTITPEVFSLDRRYLLFSRDKLREIWERS